MHWISWFYGYAGKKDVLYAKLLGIKHGLTHVWQLGYRELLCGSKLHGGYCLGAVRLWVAGEWLQVVVIVGVGVHPLLSPLDIIKA